MARPRGDNVVAGRSVTRRGHLPALPWRRPVASRHRRASPPGCPADPGRDDRAPRCLYGACAADGTDVPYSSTATHRIRTARHTGNRVALAGCYRPPLGRLGAGLDRAVLSRVATATIRALLRSVAEAAASPEHAPAHQEGTGPRTRKEPARAPGSPPRPPPPCSSSMASLPRRRWAQGGNSPLADLI